MLRWRKVRTIVRREYTSRVQTRAFWISTLAVPVLMLVFTVGPSLLASRTGGAYTVAVVTGDDALAQLIVERLEGRTERDRGKAGAILVDVERVRPGELGPGLRTEIKRAVVEDRWDGALLLGEHPGEAETFEYLSTNVTSLRLMSRLEAAVQGAVVEQRLTAEGLPVERIEALTREPGMVPVRLADSLEENREGSLQTFVFSYALMFLLFFTVMIYGFYVMRGVLEEKSSRIVEVIVANISPQELMVGKIVGVGAVGLTQYAIWVVLAMNLAVPGVLPALIGTGEATVMISPALLGFFVLFFVLGYVLYSTLYAAVGALFNSEEEAQQMQSVAGWIMAVPFLLMFPIMNNPNSTLSTVVSLVPLFSPMLFFLRMSVQPPPLWQTVLCIGLLLATIVLVARFAATLYRIGILMYGKPPTLREVWRLARSSGT